MDWLQILPSLGLGTVLGGVLGALIQARTSKASDERKALQEQVSRDHADKVRAEERMYEIACQFTKTATEVSMSAIDVDGVFNAIRDWALSARDTRDPNAVAKTEFASRRVKDVGRLAAGMSELQLVAPPAIIDAAQRVIAAAQVHAQSMTEPLTEPVLTKALGEAIADFVRTFRAETGREEYTESHARDAVMTLMTKLEAQVNDYISEFEREVRRAGFPPARGFSSG